MKTMMTILAVLLTAGAASAQGVSGDDVMGIFFDREAYANAYATSTGYEAVVAYLCLVNPSAPGGVAGFQCEVDVESDPMTLMWVLAPNLINAGSTPDFFAAFLPPYPQDNVVVLAQCTVLVPTTADAARFFVGPYSGAPAPDDGPPAYAGGADPSNLLPCEIFSGSPDRPCALINDLPPNEETNWGGVKVLFQD